MSYEGPQPLPVPSGMTGATTLSGVITGNGTSAYSATLITQYGVLIGAASNTVSSALPDGVGTGLLGAAVGAPSFKSLAYAGGAYVLLSSQPASNVATLTFTTGLSSTYNCYQIWLTNVYPVTDNVTFSFQISTDGGVTWQSTNYQSGSTRIPYNTITNTNANTTSNITLATAVSNNTAYAPLAGLISLYTLQSASNQMICNASLTSPLTGASNVLTFQSAVGTNTVSTQINGIQFSFSSGNISSGTFSLFGWRGI